VAIYGAFVDIGVGREGLVPLSQLSDRPVSSPTDVVHLGDMVSVRVVKVDPRKKRISLSMREPAVERQADTAKLADLQSGTVVDGVVASLTRFGAFVDIGVGRDGLIPMSHLPQGKTESLQVGEEVRVRIVDVDRKANRIRLSMRNVYDTDQLTSLEAGDIVQGKITSLAAFGAFVDLGVGKDGLIHISTMGDGDVRHPREVLRVGEAVEVRILDVDPDTQRISLTMQLEEEEAEEDWVFEPEEEEEEPLGEVTLEDLAARFNKMRVEGQGEPTRRTSRAEREKRAVREALQRTLDTVKDE
jgi:transcriptional accessory protein Tex/SPT6